MKFINELKAFEDLAIVYNLQTHKGLKSAKYY